MVCISRTYRVCFLAFIVDPTFPKVCVLCLTFQNVYSVNFLGYILHYIQVLSLPYLSFVIICVCMVGQVGNFLQRHKDWILLPTAGSSKQNINFLCIFPIPMHTVLVYQFFGFSKKSVYLKLARAQCLALFCFSNLYRFTVFTFVKVELLSYFALSSQRH